VGDHEITLEAGRTTLDQISERDRRGVRGDDAAVFADLLDFVVQRLLQIEPLDDGFDDEIAVGELAEVIVDVAGFDQLGGLRTHEGSRIGLQHLLDGSLGDDVAIGCILGNDVEQQNGQARVGDVSGDASPHHASADDGDAFDLSH
jgi:hypothetical protein